MPAWDLYSTQIPTAGLVLSYEFSRKLFRIPKWMCWTLGGLTHAVEGTHKDMIRVQLLGVWVLGLLGQGVLNSLGQLQELPLVHALPCLGPFELAIRIHSWCRVQGARGVVFKGQEE